MWENLAEVQNALQDKAGAIESLKKALAMDPRNNEYLSLLAKWQGSMRATGPRPVSREAKRVNPFPTLW
jgi:cytochrome c-type biogenesis protein CcmH/NrfG